MEVRQEIQSIKVYRYDKTAGTFSRITTITDYQEFTFERILNDIGQFSFVLDLNSPNVAKIKEDDIIQIGTESQRQGIIETIETVIVESRGNPTESVTYEGTTLNSILTSSYAFPPSGSSQKVFTNTAVETIMKTLLDESRINNTIVPTVNIPILQNDTDQGRGVLIDDAFRYNKLSTQFTRLCTATGLGYYIYADFLNNTLNFDIIEGTDRSTGTTVVKLSFERGNVGQIVHTKNRMSYRNHAIIAGDGSGASRTIRYLDDIDTEDPWAMSLFVDARDQTTEQGLDDEGWSALADKARNESIEITSISSFHSQIDRDFFLGDIVKSVIPQINVEKDFQIVGIVENYTDKGIRYNLTLGNTVSDITDAIIQELQKTDKVVVE